jgi:hypothetical protein
MLEDVFLDRKRRDIAPFIFLVLGLFFILLGYILTRAYFFWANVSYFSTETSNGDLCTNHLLRSYEIITKSKKE